jgi:hypothetical protein
MFSREKSGLRASRFSSNTAIFIRHYSVLVSAEPV